MENKNFQTMGYRKGKFPCKYLGIQIEKGTSNRNTSEPILDKLEKKTNN